MANQAKPGLSDSEALAKIRDLLSTMSWECEYSIWTYRGKPVTLDEEGHKFIAVDGQPIDQVTDWPAGLEQTPCGECDDCVLSSLGVGTIHRTWHGKFEDVRVA